MKFARWTWRTHSCAMSLTFPNTAQSASKIVGRTPWSAADALVGLLGMDEPVSAGPGGPARTRGSAPHFSLSFAGLGKLSDIAHSCVRVHTRVNAWCSMNVMSAASFRRCYNQVSYWIQNLNPFAVGPRISYVESRKMERARN
jgi:hypothetical protein